ncbi:cell surface protein [Myroides sp. LJL115]
MMKLKTYLILLIAIFSLGIWSCSNDDHLIADEDEIILTGPLQLAESYKVDRSTWLDIYPKLGEFSNPTVVWTQKKYNSVDKEIFLGNDPFLEFISLDLGTYTIRVTVSDFQQEVEQEFEVEVVQEKKRFVSHITRVFDFQPAYGQFVNKYPAYTQGDTKVEMLHKVQELLSKPKADLVSLGGFGGFIEFGFDHSIVNVPGQADFRVLGNAFIAQENQILTTGASEPGIILVAQDKNRNGKPDPNEWYEIAGSEYHNAKTIKNYQITYYKPTADLDAAKGQVLEYVKWSDNQGNQGYKPKNASHQQSYYPLWIEHSSITFEGTLLPDNANKTQNSWSYTMYDYGYADNYPNTHDKSAIDISWAVDKDGNKVHLKAIDFIRVYSGVNQQVGILGESSTEITGAVDLHLEQINISTIKYEN